MYVDVTCQRCGTFFPVKAYRAAKARYCSHKCYSGPRVTLTCLRCGREYEASPYQKKAGQRYCSLECRYTPVPLSERLAAKTRRTATCWLFTGRPDSTGYGRLILPDKTKVAIHRLALEIASGAPIPEGFMALHTCDTRICVRNDDEGIYEVNGIVRPRWGHLWLGTTADNTADRTSKGRSASGDNNGSRTHPESRPRGTAHWRTHAVGR